MELKQGYKQTEVGVIPEDWDTGTLGQFWSVIDCKHVTASFTPSGYPVASIREVQAKYVDLSNCKYTDKCFFDLLIEGGRQPRAGDLVISRNATVGEVAQVAKEHPQFAMGQDVCLLQRRKKEFSATYLQALLQSSSITEQFAAMMVGSTFKRANVEQIRSLKVAMPPSPEQNLIAEQLDCIDGTISAMSAFITKKQGVKQATMQELLTGKRRLPGFEGEWEAKRLGDVAHIKTGSKNNEDKVEDGEYPFFVRSDNVERIGSYSYDCEAVLVPGEGRIGDIFHYIKGRFDVHQRVYAITQFAREVSGKFVHCYMAMNFGTWAMQNTVKATVDSLRLPTFQTFEMRVPPTKDEQDAIAGVLTEIDTELAALEARKDKAQMLKQGMMQQLLTGKVRLK
jgi:type I restriction enzyme S subunit